MAARFKGNRMNRIQIAKFALVAAFLSGAVNATPLEDFKAVLKNKYPNSTFGEIKETPIPGVFEIGMGKYPAYVEKDGRYFIFGALYDMQEQVDLSTNSVKQAKAIDFKDLPLESAIKVVKGDGSRVFAVFTDPDCPFCRQLHNDLERISNATIYYFLFPIANLHPEAKAKAVSVWCSKNQTEAMNKLMLKGVDPKKIECNNPIESNVNTASKYGINGTPTLIRFDGNVAIGARPVSEIDRWLNEGTK